MTHDPNRAVVGANTGPCCPLHDQMFAVAQKHFIRRNKNQYIELNLLFGESLGLPRIDRWERQPHGGASGRTDEALTTLINKVARGERIGLADKIKCYLSQIFA